MKNKPAPVATATTPALAPALAPGLRRYLYFTAAITGGVIMLVEILGAKMLSPYVGTSHFVWVAQIGVTLIALAVGYYLGGRMADASTNLGRLYLAHLAAAIWICGSVLVVEPVAFWCLDFRLALGTVFASLILYFVPLTLMAMTGPFLIRAVAESLVGVGGQMGRLSAVSTFGSFIGTVCIGYVLIPLLPNSTTMILSALLLIVVVSIYFLRWGRGSSKAPVVAGWLIVGACAFAASRSQSAQLQGAKELFRGNSHFGMLQVVETSDTLYFLNDFLYQNTYDPRTKQSTSLFTFMLAELAHVYTPKVETALCIGMGVGIVPRELAREGVAVDVVEINPAVIPVATDFFDFETSKMRSLVIGDGRHYLNRGTNRYDTIILDAFLGDSSPSHLMTREAFRAMHRRLKADGTLVINSFGELDPFNNFFTASLEKTLKSVFAHVRIHANGNGNVFFVATDAELKRHREVDLKKVHPSMQGPVHRAFLRTLDPEPDEGIVLTDDFNPVDFHDSSNRERNRRDLAFGMKHH